MDPSSMKEEQAAGPKRCSNLCGFFANPNCGDMCSKCSREVAASQAQAVKAIAATAPQPPPQSVAPQPSAALAQDPSLGTMAAPAAAPAAASPQHSGSAAAAAQPQQPSPTAAPVATAAAALPTLPALQADQGQTPLSKGAAPVVAAEAAVAGSSSAAAAAADEADDEEPPRRVQKHTNRCFSCAKKVGLTGFKCRCGYVFCGPHRLAEAHHCDYDYKATGREHLAKANPLVQADRVQRF